MIVKLNLYTIMIITIYKNQSIKITIIVMMTLFLESSHGSIFIKIHLGNVQYVLIYDYFFYKDIMIKII